jgi:hypothetical protein
VSSRKKYGRNKEGKYGRNLKENVPLASPQIKRSKAMEQ